jgi:hypothetical protein
LRESAELWSAPRRRRSLPSPRTYIFIFVMPLVRQSVVSMSRHGGVVDSARHGTAASPLLCLARTQFAGGSEHYEPIVPLILPLDDMQHSLLYPLCRCSPQLSRRHFEPGGRPQDPCNRVVQAIARCVRKLRTPSATGACQNGVKVRMAH